MISTLTAALSDGDASAVIKQLRGENQSLIDEIGTLTAENADLERRRAYHQKGKLEARQRCAELDEAIRDSDKQMQQLQRQLQRLQWENHDLQAAVEEAQAGQQDLKEQVVQYKKMISNTTRTEDQASDESINEKAGQLFFRVQNFAVKYFRKAQLSESTPTIFEILPDKLTMSQTTTLSRRMSSPGWARTSPTFAHCHPTVESR